MSAHTACWHTHTTGTIALADISPSWHFAASIPRGMCIGRTVREGLSVLQPLLAGLLLPQKKKRAVSNWLCLGWGQAVCAGLRPCWGEHRDDREWHTEFGVSDLGMMWGPRLWMCAAGHVYKSSEGQDCQGAVAQPGIFWRRDAQLWKPLV